MYLSVPFKGAFLKTFGTPELSMHATTDSSPPSSPPFEMVSRSTGLDRNRMEPDILMRWIKIQFGEWFKSCADVGKQRDECLNPASGLQRHSAPIPGLLVWDAITYDTRLSIILIDSILTAEHSGHPWALCVANPGKTYSRHFLNMIMLGQTQQGCHRNTFAIYPLILVSPIPQICQQ